MTPDDIIRMAREAGCQEASHPFNPWSVTQVALERFAALVAAYTLSNIDPSKFMSFQEGMEAGRLAEREACAKVCEAHFSTMEYTDRPYNNGVKACVAAIRARGEE